MVAYNNQMLDNHTQALKHSYGCMARGTKVVYHCSLVVLVASSGFQMILLDGGVCLDRRSMAESWYCPGNLLVAWASGSYC
jgi:hypothetical protein